MRTGEAIETLAKRWKYISGLLLVIIASAFWIADQTSGLSASEKKNTSQDERLKKIEELTIHMAAKIDGIDDNLKLILQLYGIDSSKVNRWKRIPAHPVLDSATGFPAIGSKWLRMNDSRDVGRLYKVTRDSLGDMLIESVELWNLSKK